jgi:hypothetical protein
MMFKRKGMSEVLPFDTEILFNVAVIHATAPTSP